MKVINKFLLPIVMVLALALSSCEEEAPTREISPEVNPNSNNVYFPRTTESFVLGLSENTIVIPIARAVSTNQLTVKLKLTADNAFSIPETVSFAAGEKETSFVLTVGNIDLVKNYPVDITVIDEDQINPYSTTNPPGLGIRVLREDFAPYSLGDYYSGWWEEELGELVMEYSPAINQYRIKEFCGYPGYNATFTWNGGSTIAMVGGITIPTTTRTGFPTGYVHPSYGMVYASYAAAEGTFTYDAETKTFEFGYAWRVEAGTFGVDPDYYTITSLY